MLGTRQFFPFFFFFMFFSLSFPLSSSPFFFLPFLLGACNGRLSYGFQEMESASDVVNFVLLLLDVLFLPFFFLVVSFFPFLGGTSFCIETFLTVSCG